MSYVVPLILAATILRLEVFGKVPVGFKSVQHCKEFSKQKYEAPNNIFFPAQQPTTMKYPFIVSIYQDEENSTLVCGGVLIDKRFVLTAAHCLKEPVYATFIKVGSESGGRDRYNISRRIIYPSRSTSNDYHDIGLIELAKDVEFSTNVHPACLQVTKNIPGDDWMTILWSSSKNKTYNLTTFPTYEVKFDGCQDVFNMDITPLGVVDYLQICVREDREEVNVGTSTEGHAAIIRKDVSTQQFVAFGIPSIGIRTNSFGWPYANSYPKLSTRISSYIGWIESIVWPGNIMQGCNKINFEM